jgi:NAD-dependent SIR2 family protein deacetylase
MPSNFASGKYAIAECDRCGQRYKLTQLKKLTIKTKQVSIKVCPECWEPDQPQLQLGMYPVNDPQAVREPRPDISYYASGVDNAGYVSGGSRVFQWGWNPVGGASNFDTVLTPNYLIAVGQVGTVTISTT